MKERIVVSLEFVRCFPHILAFLLSKKQAVIKKDIRVTLSNYNKHYSYIFGLVYLLSYFPEFRNLFYYRVGSIRHILRIFCPKMSSLVLNADKIGEGFLIQHGFNTRIGATSVGRNCWVLHGVTIGHTEKGKPTILDNVRILTGAIVLGKVTVGNNCIIGANAVVVKDVPDNRTVVGVYPTYIVRRNGQAVKEIL